MRGRAIAVEEHQEHRSSSDCRVVVPEHDAEQEQYTILVCADDPNADGTFRGNWLETTGHDELPPAETVLGLRSCVVDGWPDDATGPRSDRMVFAGDPGASTLPKSPRRSARDLRGSSLKPPLSCTTSWKPSLAAVARRASATRLPPLRCSHRPPPRSAIHSNPIGFSRWSLTALSRSMS